MIRLCVALALLALATMPVGSAMAASPRDTPEYYVTPPPETPEERRNRRVAEMETALGRLVGKFGIERPWVFSQPPPPPSAARTMLDCMAIGAGVGVHCVLLTVLPQAPDRQLRARAPSMVSTVTEYGIDPNASRVRLMKVERGSAVRLEGGVSGNTLTLWGAVQQRMTASADSEDIWVTEYKDWWPSARYALRRLSQEEVDAANWSVEGARPTFPSKPGRPR